MQYNRFNQPIGESITDFNNPPMPHFSTLTGIYCRLEKFTEHHIDDLYMHFKEESDAPNWTYLPDDQPQTYIAFKEQFREKITSKDPYYIAVIDKSSNRALGIVSLLRINCNHGTIEVGHIHYSNQLQKSRIATEAQFLLARHVFDNLGYRRYEWKCDALNQPSKKAAQRLGFQYEGTFRNHVIYKGRTRDTSWFAMTDSDWYNIKPFYERWLDPTNFDEEGRQRTTLSIK